MIKFSLAMPASQDSNSALRLYKDLKTKSDLNPWLDKKNLLPGQTWNLEIRKAIKNSRYFIALFSSTSVQKRGYIQKEFRFALDVLDEFPEGEIFAIPARLDDCEIPYERFNDIERVDLFPNWEEGMRRLLRTFKISEITSLPSIENLLDKDPSVSIPSVERLLKEEKIDLNVIDKILGSKDFGTVNLYVLRKLCKAFPQQSAPMLINLILKADQNWHLAQRAADCLSLAHRKFAEDELCNRLRGWVYGENPHVPIHIDIVRTCIEGLGNLGAQDCIYPISDTIIDKDHYRTGFYDKLYYYVCNALAQIFVHSSNTTAHNRLWDYSSRLQHVLKFVMSQPEEGYTSPSTEYYIKRVLAGCTSDHVDVLIKEWLYSEDQFFRKIGAYALGSTGISRAVPYLIKALDIESDDDALKAISKALGYIGGNDAASALLRREQIEPIAYTLEDLDFKIYDESIQKLLQLINTSNGNEHSQTALLVYRAIGLKKDKRYIDNLRKLLHTSNPAVRGVAALALARINGKQELDTLKKAYSESGEPLERVMSGLSLLEISSPQSNDILIRLRQDLAIDSYNYILPFKKDILSILRNTQKPLAILIANSWESVYNEDPYKF